MFEENPKLLRHHNVLCRMIFLGETHMKEAEDDEFLHGKQRDAKQGDHHQLDRAYFSQEGTVSDQRAGTAEVCVDQTVGDTQKGQEQGQDERKL